MGIIPPFKFTGGTTKQGRTDKIQGFEDTDISVSTIKYVGVPVEEDFSDIGINDRRAVIYL